MVRWSGAVAAAAVVVSSVVLLLIGGFNFVVAVTMLCRPGEGDAMKTIVCLLGGCKENLNTSTSSIHLLSLPFRLQLLSCDYHCLDRSWNRPNTSSLPFHPVVVSSDCLVTR